MNFIHDICKQYGITNYTINDDGSIDVNGDVDLYDENLTKLPLNFNRVDGWFDCNDNQLTSLKSSPKWVGGGFWCNYNRLSSLEFSPEYVGGEFDCSHNGLTSLKGCPKWVGSRFNCYNNRLTSLEFSPDYVGSYFNCRYNDLTNNYSETEIGGGFFTTSKQSGLIIDECGIATNYNEWRKIYKRKKILDEISKIYNEK
jgi:hypothetical protein